MLRQLPARADVTATALWVEKVTLPGHIFGERQIMMLLPGGPGGNHSIYNAIKNDLVQYADLILFDPRGCGKSLPAPTHECSIFEYINDIEALRKSFNLNNFVLLGGSYGAMAALGYACQYSTHLNKLILLAGAANGGFLTTAQANLQRLGTAEQIEAATKLFAGDLQSHKDFDHYCQITAPLYMYAPATNTTESERNKSPYNIQVTNFGFKFFLKQFDFSAQLNQVHCPTLIMVGENDWINDPQHAEFIANNIPNAHLQKFSQCGHFIWVDQKKKFLLAMQDFLLDKHHYNKKLKL